ncbi:MAG: hypothetical protein M3Q58_04660 [Bacteroidota bacterium]|nr:hypothetical protein [Bacteroidota bacterium]
MSFIIQKIVSLASPSQLDFFEDFLKIRNNSLPLELIRTIRKHGNRASSFYAKQVYNSEDSDTLKRLNQLAHHTFKLSSCLIQHYPNFLYGTLHKVDELLLENKKEEALEKIKTASEVAEKTEDYGFSIKLYELSNQHFPHYSKTFNKTFLSDQLFAYNTLHIIIQKQDELISFTSNSDSSKKINQKDLVYFRSFFDSKSKSVQLIAKQSYLNVLSCFNHKQFYEKTTLDLIKTTLRELENHPYLLITKHKEKMMSLDYMLLKYTRLELEDKEVHLACSKIISKWRTSYPAENTINAGLFIAISIQGSYLITNYYYNKIDNALIQNISETSEMCNSLLKKVNWEKEGYLKHINFCNVYSLYLILSGEESKAIKLIEKMLHEYQQKSFKKLYDGLFVVLMMAYFQSKDYEGTINTYNRYKKITKDEPEILENDLVIKSLYYIVQLKEQEKLQYQNKLNGVLSELKNDPKLINNFHLVKRVQAALL